VIGSVENPDPVGSTPCCQVRIRSNFPTPLRFLVPGPIGIRISYQLHFHSVLTVQYAFQLTMKKNFNTFCHHLLKKRFFELVSKSGAFDSLWSDPTFKDRNRMRSKWTRSGDRKLSMFPLNPAQNEWSCRQRF
jgi:hypothetical protein